MIQHVCLESVYCGLCRFFLGYNETIVMLTEDGLSSPPFRRNLGIISGNRQFHTPDHPCTDKELARGCHEKCLEFYRRLAAGPPSADFLRAATDYKFPPPESFQEDRRAFIHVRLASNVRRICPLLPPELCERVAECLVRECAVASLRLLPRSLDASYWVSMSRNIYATFVAIDGRRYIETLSNTKDSDRAQLVWAAASEADDIYVAEDHWGLRGVLSSRKVVPSVVKAGVWWRKLSPPSRRLRADTDGWKTRCLVDAGSEGPLGPAWSSSPPPPGIGELEFLHLDRRRTPLQPSTMRLAAVRASGADIVGYSACLNGADILTLRAHIKGEPPPLSFYRDIDYSGAVWLYMPVEPDERISEIRLRERGKVVNNTSGPALMLVSDKGRAIMLGPYLAPKLRPWVLLSRFTGRHSNLVFNTASDVVTAVACSDGHLDPAPECEYHPSQVPSSPPPPWLQFSWGYFTSAPLDNVVRVTTCQTGSGRTLSIIGLLLEYADGSSGCVGQYRFDGVLRRLDVGDATVLRIGFGQRRLGRVHRIAEVTVDQPRGDSGSTWLELPWCGRLDWWVGPNQVELRHGS